MERLPTLARYLKADRLFALLGKNNKLAGGGERLRQLLQSAEGGQDELARSLRQLHKEHPEQFADEFVEHWDDGRRNAPGSGELVAQGPTGVGKTITVFYKDVDAFAATFDKAGTVSQAIRNQAFDLYKQGNWDELEALFKKNDLNNGWPPANGGYNILDDVKIKAGEKFDRYGGALKNYNGQGVPNLGGNFTSPMPNGRSYSFSQRALNQTENTYDFYYEIEVLQDLPFVAQNGDVIPWFNKTGGGKQSMWKIPIDTATGYPKTWNKLAQEGYIKITIKDSPSGKYLHLIGTVIQ